MVQLVETTLTLHRPDDGRPGLSASAFGAFQTWLPEATRNAVDVALRGASGKRGRKPAWWHEATSVRFLDYVQCDGTTSVVFGARQLGDATGGALDQQIIDGLEDHLWQPPPEATGIDLVATALADLLADRQDSYRLDQGVLTSFEHIKRFIGVQDAFTGLTMPVRDFASRTAVGDQIHCDANCPARAHAWRAQTPRPRSARIVGRLSMVDDRTSRFALDLDDGKRLYGLYLPDDRQSLWQGGRQRVAVLGKLVYRPNGQALRFEAESIQIDEQAGGFFSRIPEPERSWSEQHRSQLRAGTGAIGGLFGLLADEDNLDDDDHAFLEAVEAVS